MTGAWLADAVLVVHAAFVLFVVAGLPAIWIGLALGRRFARHRGLRLAHLGAIAYVVAESLLGVACPLTVWEDALRGTSGEPGFVERWLHRWMFWDWPPWAFTALYVAFGALVAATYVLFPPRARR